MVVRNDRRRRIQLKYPLNNLAGIHGRLRERSFKQLFEGDHAIQNIQKEHTEARPIVVCQLQPQVLTNMPGGAQRRARLTHPMRQDRQRRIDYCLLVGWKAPRPGAFSRRFPGVCNFTREGAGG